MTFNFRTIGIGMLFLIVGALTGAAELPLKGESQIKFEYELTRKDAQKLESEVAGLKKGSSLDAVKSLLGKPDAERTLQAILWRREVCRKRNYLRIETCAYWK